MPAETRPKVLAQLRPANTNAASLYSPPDNTTTEFTKLVICNQTGSSATFRVFLDDDGTTYDQTTAIFYDQPISANLTWIEDLKGWGMNKTAGNLAVTTDSAGAVTVENMHGGDEAGRMKAVIVDYVVTAQDVLADEVNIPLPFTPTGFVVNARTTAGVIDAVTVEAAMQASPDRLRLNFAGATDPVAGDIVHAIVWG